MKAVWKILFLAAFGLCFYTDVSAQACGFSFSYFYVRDSDGKTIGDAKIEIYSSDEEGDQHLKEATRTAWVEDRLAYLVSHGLCSEHFKVRLRISAKGFETLEEVINLEFGTYAYAVRLKRAGTKEQTSFERLAHIHGKIADTSDRRLENIRVVLTDKSGKKTETKSNDRGGYELDVPFGEYSISVIGSNSSASMADFKKFRLSKLTNQLSIVLPSDARSDNSTTAIECEPPGENPNYSVCILVVKNPEKEKQK